MNFARKSLLSLSLLGAAAVSFTACGGGAPAGTETYDFNGKTVIDGGVYYPVVDGQTATYAVNTAVAKSNFNFGRTPTANEIAAWNKDVTPTVLPPKGKGTVSEGEELYEEQCVMCHGDFGSGGGGYPALSKGNAYENVASMKLQRDYEGADEGPIRVFGSYWPDASTMWWYIQSGMPHPKTKSLSDDETYALTAYMLSINELKVDGVVVDDDDFELNRENFGKIEMPNKDGFVPNIDGPGAIEDVRKFWTDPKEFGGQNLNKGAERCMTNCQKDTVSTVRIKGVGISDFLPPMDVTRDLPGDVKFDAKAEYGNSCAACHSGFLSPGSSDWKAYTAKGMKKVYANGIHGTDGGMPPKGGSSLSDKDFKAVVDYLVHGK
jgi:S-disulfanyl-L-cysteine oxidoreductase SoxD